MKKDTICIPIEQARELVIINEIAKDLRQENELLRKKIDNHQEQIGIQADRINDYMAIEGKYKENEAAYKSEVNLMLSETKSLEKKLRKQKFKTVMVCIGAAVVEALTIYLLVK